MSNITNNQSMRIYDFNTLKKTFKIQDVSNIGTYSVPEEYMPKVKNQGDYCCCVACVLAEVLEFFHKVETGTYKEMSVGYIYAKHRPVGSNSTGMAIESALKSLLNFGTVPQDVCNLLLEMPEIQRLLKDRTDLDEIAVPSHIEGYCKIGWRDNNQKIENIKLALVNTNTPLIVRVEKGFPEPHCLLAYGITDDNRIMIQNSWGENWGINGRVTLHMDDIEKVYMVMDHKVVLPFKDVPEDAWFYKNILHMYSAGYISGKTEDSFDPNSPITRAEVCVILDRILKNIDQINQSTNMTLEERFQRIENKICLY